MTQNLADNPLSASRNDPSNVESPLRLSVREWFVTILIVWFVAGSASAIWKHVEPLDTSEDFRIPFTWSDDYWTYQRHVEHSIRANKILVLGDSVVWGEYVAPANSLHAELNKVASNQIPAHPLAGDHSTPTVGGVFANGGVNGMHPLALQGLLKDYASAICDRKVILHCNLLWTSSPERDLQVDEEISFNHPDLLPQFSSQILSYRASAEHRLSMSLQNRLSYRAVSRHFRVTNFEFQDIPSWSLEHPYQPPWQQLCFAATSPLNQSHSPPTVWTEKIRGEIDMPWVELEDSNQWLAFRDCVKVLRSRNNDVFVIVGPFNEHCLTEKSRKRYRQNVDFVSSWLETNGVRNFVPEVLPADQYGDASHPLSSGYQTLAEGIVSSADFAEWFNAEHH